mmetsp:Transcript_34453/g.83095  ORF Transcript_34453/g.83095 Transcript_34453/m.83095 type:complete len:130 (-) Transcript_34453:1528-1917(-)
MTNENKMASPIHIYSGCKKRSPRPTVRIEIKANQIESPGEGILSSSGSRYTQNTLAQNATKHNHPVVNIAKTVKVEIGRLKHGARNRFTKSSYNASTTAPVVANSDAKATIETKPKITAVTRPAVVTGA